MCRDAGFNRKLGCALQREGSLGKVEVERDGFRPVGHHVLSDTSTDNASFGLVTVDVSAWVDWDCGRHGFDNSFSPVRFLSQGFVEVNTLGVVVLMEVDREIEARVTE